jgi:superoxide dismutase, Fe-Mn family
MREGGLMDFECWVMPYDYSELEPAMSRDSVMFHFLRHQRLCFERMRALVRGTELEPLALEELICKTEHSPGDRALHRSAAEVWNHNLFWRSMHPCGGGQAYGRVGEALRRRFGSYERFTHAFMAAANAHFGSGWLWLVWCAGTLEIVATHDAATPLTRGGTALLALDLWEHAYYLDHQNRRAAYVATFLEELVSWETANRLLAGIAAAESAVERRPRAPAASAEERPRLS